MLELKLNNIKKILDTFEDYDRCYSSNIDNYSLQYIKLLQPQLECCTAEGLLEYFYSEEGKWKEALCLMNKTISTGEVIDSDRIENCSDWLQRNVWYNVKDVHNISTLEILHLAYGQMDAIIRYHPFKDGNKRTGAMACFQIAESVLEKQLFINDDIQQFMAFVVIKNLENENYPVDPRQYWVDTMLSGLI